MNIDKLLTLALDYSSADQTEAGIWNGKSALTRFANSTIHQNMVSENGTLNVRVVFGKKVASASTNRLDEDGVKELVDSVVSMAKLQDDNKDFVSLPKPVVPVQSVKSYYDSTANFTAADRAEAVKKVVSEADKVGATAAGAFTVNSYERAIKNTLGVNESCNGTDANLLTVITGPDGGYGYAAAMSGNVDDIDGRAVGEEASARARDSKNPIGIEPGDYECILMPYAVYTLVTELAWMGFDAKDYQDGQSFLCGKLGEKIVDESINIWDDGLDTRTLATPFDSEGIACQRVDFIKNGVASGLTYDSYSAHREGKQSTGHSRGYNLIMAPGNATVEDMIASTKRGLMVTRINYANEAHRMTATITGMTRDGTFLIEDGKITKPVKNLRITQSILEALSNTEMIGRDLKLFRGMLVPSLKVSKFRFSSASEY